MMKHWISDIVLTGKTVELRPLSSQHRQALINAASDGELWDLWYTGVPSEQSVDNYIKEALQAKENNGELPFVIYHLETGKIIGCTRYCHVDNSNQRLEIGYTWYSKSYQRTGVNTETKLLLLTHAFETLSSIAVEFRTHWFNQRSREAILKLGAKQDGVLRNHHKLPDGSLRDTVVYSIIESEWLSVRRHLLSKLVD